MRWGLYDSLCLLLLSLILILSLCFFGFGSFDWDARGLCITC